MYYQTHQQWYLAKPCGVRHTKVTAGVTYGIPSHHCHRSSLAARHTARPPGCSARYCTWSFQECCIHWWSYSQATAGSLQQQQRETETLQGTQKRQQKQSQSKMLISSTTNFRQTILTPVILLYHPISILNAVLGSTSFLKSWFHRFSSHTLHFTDFVLFSSWVRMFSLLHILRSKWLAKKAL